MARRLSRDQKRAKKLQKQHERQQFLSARARVHAVKQARTHFPSFDHVKVLSIGEGPVKGFAYTTALNEQKKKESRAGCCC